MKDVPLGSSGLSVPAVIVGCMRVEELDANALGRFVHTALENGACFFDHADIYGGGACEEHFGAILRSEPSIRREDMILQSKCGIRQGFYDSSKQHILHAVDESLKRVQTRKSIFRKAKISNRFIWLKFHDNRIVFDLYDTRMDENGNNWEQN